MSPFTLWEYCIWDLHAHTTDSDGSRTNFERVQEVRILDKKKTGIWAVTNHDTYSPSFVTEVRAIGCKAVYGTEISAYSAHLDLSIHVTCYTPVVTESIKKMVSTIVEARNTKISLQIQQLQSQGFPISEPEFYTWIEEQGMSVRFASNWHIAVYLWQNKQARWLFLEATSWKVTTIEGVLHECLKKTGHHAHIGHYQIPPYEPSLEMLAALAEKDEMVLSIAHPNFSFLKYMKQQGVPMNSLDHQAYFHQVIYPKLVKEWIRNLEINALANQGWANTIRRCVQKTEWMITFWSDNHGGTEPDPRHGIYGQVNTYLTQEDIAPIYQKLLDFCG
jgi:hypothetical protein